MNEDIILANVTLLSIKMQELQAILEKLSSKSTTGVEKAVKKSKRGNQKLPKIRYRYSPTELVTRASFSMTPSMFEQLDSYATSSGKTRTEVVVDALMKSGIVTVQRELPTEIRE